MVKATYNNDIQPDSFEFSAANKKKVKDIIARYPVGGERSAVMPLLDLAQRQHDNWIPRAAMDKIAEILNLPPVKVYEVATFYTMYNLEPVGKHHIQVCGTTPCKLCGSDGIMGACKKKLGIEMGETTKDGLFTLSEVECLGACVNAPVVQIGDDYYEDLTPETMETLLDDLAKGKKVTVGTQVARENAAPKTGRTTLVDDTPKSKKGGKK